MHKLFVWKPLFLTYVIVTITINYYLGESFMHFKTSNFYFHSWIPPLAFRAREYALCNMIGTSRKMSVFIQGNTSAKKWPNTVVHNDSFHISSKIKISGFPNLDVLKNFIRSAKERGEIITTNYYNECIIAFNRHKRYEEAYELYMVMRGNAVEPNIVTYTSAIALLGRLKRGNDAIQLYHESRDQGHGDDVLYNVILTALIRCNQFPDCIQLFQEMRQSAVLKSSTPYTTLMMLYSKLSDWRKALSIYNAIREDGLKPSSKSRKVIEQILRKSKQYQLADNIDTLGKFSSLSHLSGETLSLTPSPSSASAPLSDAAISLNYTSSSVEKSPKIDFSVIIREARRSGDFRAAVAAADVWRETQTHLTPGGVTACIHIYGYARQAEKAMDLLRQVEERKRAVPTRSDRSVGGINTVQYNACMTACVRSGRLKEAVQMFRDMDFRLSRADNLSDRVVNDLPDSSRVNSVMNKKRSYRDVYSYCIALSALDKLGETEAVMSLFEAMIQSGISPNIFTYNCLLKMFGRLGRWKEALECFESMSMHGVVPDKISVHTLVMSLEKAQQWDLSAQYRQKLLKQSSPVSLEHLSISRKSLSDSLSPISLSPPVVGDTISDPVHDLSLSGTLTHSETDISGTLQEKLLEQSGVSTIRMLGMVGHLERAIGCLADMRRAGKSPQTAHYNAAINACGECGDWSRAIVVFEEMVDFDIPRSLTVYRSIVDILERNKQNEKMTEFLQRAERENMTLFDKMKVM